MVRLDELEKFTAQDMRDFENSKLPIPLTRANVRKIEALKSGKKLWLRIDDFIKSEGYIYSDLLTDEVVLILTGTPKRIKDYVMDAKRTEAMSYLRQASVIEFDHPCFVRPWSRKAA